MLGKTIVEGLKLIDSDFQPCPYQSLTSTNKSHKIQRLTKHEVAIKVNPNKPVNSTIMRAQTTVMHIMSYDILFGQIIYYNPLRVTIYFWMEIVYY
jgi:hypothetical protein